MSEESKQVADVADERVYTLRRLFIFEREEVKTLVLDFDKLTGEDILQAERRFNAEVNERGLVKEVSKAYQVYIVAAAAGVPVEMIKALPAKDFTAVTLRAQDFLLM